jgi:ribosome maturation factor RimP
MDPHGPTPHLEPDPFPEVDLDSLPENHYDESNHPVPHQPWRRGDTDGCHDPLTAPWRLEAEAIISDAVNLVGGRVVDVTWYMAKCVISLDEKSLRNVVGYVDGPEVRIVYPDDTDVTGHIWDPSATNGDDDMEEMYTEEDEILDYEQYDEDIEHEILKANMPVEYDEATGKELPPREPRSREERAQEMRDEWDTRFLDEPRMERPDDGMFSHPVDTKALSVVSQAITTALAVEDVEERLQILSRHDVILTSPLDNPCILDSQREYDDALGLDVYVETRDPWGSNRVLFGKLVDRNALDVVINQDNTGRMVTIPHSMIHQVLLPSGLARGSARIKAGMTMDDDDDGDGEDDDDDDDDGDEGDDEYGDGGDNREDDDNEDDGGYLDVEEEEVFE